MIRQPLAVALASGLLWVGTSSVPAQEAKPGVSPQAQKINELIAKGWADADIKRTAGRANDHEFLRRAFIDLIGRIPTPEEIVDFEQDHAANKRAKLVFRLLNDTAYKPRGTSGRPVTAIKGLKMPKDGIDYNDAYAQNFGELWTTWLLTRSNTLPLYREQLHLWLTQQFVTTRENPQSRPWNKVVFDLISATGKGNDNGAVIFVIRHLGEPIVAEAGQRVDYVKEGKYDAVPITSRVTKLFLGIQSQCVQCHDHPFHKEYVQSDFWGVNGFFRQTDRSATTNPRNLGAGVTPPQISLTDVPTWNTNGMVLYERRDGQRKASFPAMIRDLLQFDRGEISAKRLVAGNMPEALAGKSRRQVLAQWVIEHDNFARAFVNRMWGHLFGRGLQEEPSVADFNSDNKIVHPELLDYLAEEFKKYNYDPKKLLEWICTSDVYSLSHVVRDKTYADPKYDPYFARMPLKAMSPEVMFDSLAIATRAETRKNEEEYKKLKTAWGAKLTQNFGDDEGNEINFNGTVVQALLMMNGREINGEIGSGRGRGDGGVVADVMKRLGSNEDKIYDELFMMTLSRHPTADEKGKLHKVWLGRASINLAPAAPPKPKGKGPNRPPKKGASVLVPGAFANDMAFYQDVFWALLNSSEFMLNH
jgi:hypothetical protein